MIVIDQAIAGSSNVFITVLAARFLGVASFGFFGIIFLIYTLFLGVVRSFVCDPLLIHPTEARERPGDILGTAVALGLAVGAIVSIGGLVAGVWNPHFGGALLVLGLCLPLLVLQDVGRYLGFATAKPSLAVVLDSAWMVLQVFAVAAAFLLDLRTLAWFILAWAGAGAVSGAYTLIVYRGAGTRLNLIWLRHTWAFSWRYLVSYTSTFSSALIATVFIGGLVGAKAVGALQGTVLLVRPAATVQAAAVAGGVSEIARTAVAGRDVRRLASKSSMVAATVALLNGIVMLALPDRLGRLILGATWAAAHPLLLPVAVQILCVGLLAGGRAALLGTRAIRIAVVIDVVSTVMFLIAVLIGALLGGTLGALWAVAASQMIITVVWLVVAIRHANAWQGEQVVEPIEEEATAEERGITPAGKHRRSVRLSARKPVRAPVEVVAPLMAGRLEPLRPWWPDHGAVARASDRSGDEGQSKRLPW